MQKFLIITALISLTACADTSEIMDTGNGTYMIAASAMNIRGGTVHAKQAAYDDAKDFCAKSGKSAVLTDVQTDPAFVENHHSSTDVHFRCE